MNNHFSFNDIIRKNFLEMSTYTPNTIFEILFCFVIALLIGLLIFYIYKKVFRGVVYSHSYNVSLVMMCLTTAFIIKTISSNVVLSLGMVGALSIVRFRTALKDPMDIVFMFWAIGAGITAGAGIYPICVIGSIFIGIVLVVMLKQPSHNNSDYLLIIHYHQEKVSDAVKKSIGNLKYSVKSKTVTPNNIEWIVQLKLKGDNTAFVNDISVIEGVDDVSLVSYNGEYAV
jgi:uncharacterized membrane protein YhiD involved in acid resistance